MLQKTYITLLFLLVASCAFAQKTERDYLRSGNKLYNDSLFIKAEVDYRKALEINPKSTDAMFNLGNSLLMQQKAKEAMEQFESASKVEKDKDKLAQIYHNMGVILQSSKQYPQCIEAYKESLRNNPKDDETRYNLALAQKLMIRIKIKNKIRKTTKRIRTKTSKNRIRKTNKIKISSNSSKIRMKCPRKMPNNY